MKTLFGFVSFLVYCHFSNAYLKLSIFPYAKSIIAKENEDLSLVCRVAVPETMSNKLFPLSWTLPIKKSSSENRVFIREGYNERNVTIHKLRESDTGEYTCEVNEGNIKRLQKVSILVKPGKAACVRPRFACDNGMCIPWNYVCDGYKDCPDGSDESVAHCGADACKGKISCDGRCIPSKLCCDPAVDPTCSASYLMSCCNVRYNLPLDMHSLVVHTRDSPVQYKYQNLGFYQSTVYTMISCAVAFIFMSTVMLIAVCRFRVRHNPWFFQSSQSAAQRHRFWQNPSSNERQVNSSNNQEGAVVSLQNYSSNVDRSEILDPLENFVFLTYDANTGFEIAEYGPKPPPYTENNIGVPPPPYSSTVDISTENPAVERSNHSPANQP